MCFCLIFGPLKCLFIRDYGKLLSILRKILGGLGNTGENYK